MGETGENQSAQHFKKERNASKSSSLRCAFVRQDAPDLNTHSPEHICDSKQRLCPFLHSNAGPAGEVSNENGLQQLYLALEWSFSQV